jgi:hypothetical protein
MPHHTWWQVWEENGLIWKPWEDEELQATKSEAKLRLCDKWAAGVVCCGAALIGERRMGKLDVFFDLCVDGVNDLQ